jgi:hypothetical protein
MDLGAKLLLELWMSGEGQQTKKQVIRGDVLPSDEEDFYLVC